MITVERLAEVCWSYGTTAVSPMTTVIALDRHAELLGDDLGEDRACALAHVGRAGVEHRAAVGEQPDGRVRQPGRRAGLEADRDPAAAALGHRLAPADHLGGAAQAHRPVAIGRRVARDERIARPGEVAQPQLDRVDAEDRGPPR